MKKTYILLFLLSLSNITFSQTLYVPSGNVGTSSNGNVGIGITSPSSKLEVYENGADVRLKVHEDAGSNLAGIHMRSGSRDWFIDSQFSALTVHRDSEDTYLTIFNNGSVGIGTNTTGTHKLAVEGSIGAREIKVEVSGWSDFVFENDYELRTLEEVEQHINKNGHLPEIPSEAEITENGINLGEMDAKLLQKIEELMLYMIEMNKQLKTQAAEIGDLKIENSELKNEISILKANKKR